MAKPRTALPTAATERILSSRAGARNVAGVTYQGLAACAALMTGAPADVAAVVPEGDEDIDLLMPDGRVLVQAKQRTFRLRRSELIDALARAWSRHLSDTDVTRVAVVTDAPDLDRMEATGWSNHLGGEPAVVDGLVERLGDFGRDAAARSHLVSLRLDVATVARALAERHPTRAPFTSHLAAALLLSEVQRAAAANRDAHRGSAELIRQSDVDGLLFRVAAAEGGLLEVERSGVVTPTPFRRVSKASRGEFLSGLRARPWHVAAGYAVERPDTLGALSDALGGSNAAVVVGPSGSGKSTLMWQYAHSTLGRCFTINRLDAADVDRLSAFVEIMAPTNAAPLILCADDVGDLEMRGWPRLLERFGGDHRVVLLGTCREEMFTSALTGGGVAAAITPTLTEAEAELIGRQLPALSGHDLAAADFQQIRRDADALMMEFVHIATTNRHLGATLADQVQALQSAAVEAAPAVLRLVAAADAAGIRLEPRQLRTIGMSDDAIDTAVRKLDGEFITVADEPARSITGLHPLRSAYLLERLHTSVPTLAETFALLIRAVRLEQLEAAVIAGFRVCASNHDVLETAVIERLAVESEPWPALARVLLHAEAAAYAPVLAREFGNDVAAAELAVHGKLAGRMAPIANIGSTLQKVPMNSPAFAQAVHSMDAVSKTSSACLRRDP